MNIFGNKFRVSVFGESHGDVVGVTVDGVRPGMPLGAGDFEYDLQRRRAGIPGTTARLERDEPTILSGVYGGHTTGAPVTIIFVNENTDPGSYMKFRAHPRPSHADFAAAKKFGGWNDPRGGGHFSGRMTLALVAAGVIAKKMLVPGILFGTRIVSVGDLERAMEERDSVGGVVECCVEGVKAGLGEPFFDSVESVVSHILFAIPGVRGVEFGAGFAAAKMRGSEHNDLITDAEGRTKTNHAGGVNGGITNGNPLIFRVAVKPTSSIARAQDTFNMESEKVEPLEIAGRHDVCIALRTPPIIEAAAAIALAQF